MAVFYGAFLQQNMETYKVDFNFSTELHNKCEIVLLKNAQNLILTFKIVISFKLIDAVFLLHILWFNGKIAM